MRLLLASLAAPPLCSRGLLAAARVGWLSGEDHAVASAEDAHHHVEEREARPSSFGCQLVEVAWVTAQKWIRRSLACRHDCHENGTSKHSDDAWVGYAGTCIQP